MEETRAVDVCLNFALVLYTVMDPPSCKDKNTNLRFHKLIEAASDVDRLLRQYRTPWTHIVGPAAASDESVDDCCIMSAVASAVSSSSSCPLIDPFRLSLGVQSRSV